MIKNKANIFDNIPDKLNEELFDDIISKDALTIQRIVSQGHTTKADEWYRENHLVSCALLIA